MGKRFFHFSISLYITTAYCILIAFTILVLTVNTQPAIAGDGDTGAASGMCSGLAMKAPERRRHWRRSSVFIVHFEHYCQRWRLVLVFLLLTLGK